MRYGTGKWNKDKVFHHKMSLINLVVTYPKQLQYCGKITYFCEHVLFALYFCIILCIDHIMCKWIILDCFFSAGFSTAKGELVRSILFPKPLGFKFYRDAVKFVVLLFAIAAIGMAYSIYCYIMRDVCILLYLLFF